MPWTRWALVPRGVIGRTKHYWGFPAEVAPDAQRMDMPPARILLIEEEGDDQGDDASLMRQRQEAEKFLAGLKAQGTNIIFEESEHEGVSLYRYAEDGEFAGESWCETLQAATEQANWEYDRILEWHDVPVSLRDAKVDRTVIEALLRSLPS